MKIRIRANTVRFRLGKSEMEILRDGDAVVEMLSFGPDSSIVWSVRVGAADSDAEIESSTGVVRLTIPRLDWLEDESVEGFSTTIESAPGYQVAVSVERDYACMSPRDPAEDLDSFPNPAVGC
jgi:hypothetical protein